MRIEIPTEGIEQLIATLGFNDARNVLTGRAVSRIQELIDAEMERYAERREARQRNRIVTSPASANNKQRHSEPPPTDRPDLNYFAPKKNLQVLLSEEWFDKVSMDKKRFTVEWRNQLIEDLMKSEYRDEIAEAWANKDLRLQVKGHVMGALSAAGVLKKSALAIARVYYGTGADNTKEVKTLAKYMGDSRKVYYADWIVEYVNNLVENLAQPIEK
jgi:hypothetical protein